MDGYDIKLKPEDLVGLLTENDAMSQLLTSVLNQVLEKQMTNHLGADRYEHNDDRHGYRNGYRERKLYTRIGTLTLRVPQTRDGSFSTEIFKRYQRSEQAFVLALMEMYVQGVSTRKVTKITEELCGVSFSKSTVSQLCIELDAKLNAWRNRPLNEKRYPFLIVDALVVDVRRDEAIRSTGVLIVYGVTEAGQREPLDILIADSENEASWDMLFQRLKKRGLKDVDLVVSDDHQGLVNALKKQFQGAIWQRCQTHFIRNVLGHAPRHMKKEIANQLKLIFQASDKNTAKKLSNELISSCESKAKQAMDCFENGLEDALAVLNIPETYRKRLRTSNLAERMNEEIRRRQRVIRIFPNEDSALRLIGSILADVREEWMSGHKYFDMTEYWDWKKDQAELRIKQKVVALN
ncbi:MAG: IS256 family transposase [Gammaproteobacteria bacterium CG_4_10_14_0_8_um_filter_38_16]|nr:MAG: IS256 family transposase [Gammaproteobacteria bacterium CG_4_10_14_0_8_um_filter_38_16]PJA02811.1 MAG: IS256 family transposase [Gammaproteobacteria bacterium CG_4_10_14_0_2_um_filter_38_22]PJB09665.1 MAG: IS256 family transposase [Gammaproteobacteria bacterium CG_4_9_14_3_um_filter_38_9]